MTQERVWYDLICMIPRMKVYQPHRLLWIAIDMQEVSALTRIALLESKIVGILGVCGTAL